MKKETMGGQNTPGNKGTGTHPEEMEVGKAPKMSHQQAGEAGSGVEVPEVLTGKRKEEEGKERTSHVREECSHDERSTRENCKTRNNRKTHNNRGEGGQREPRNSQDACETRES